MLISLRPRLRQVADFVPSGARVADIGSDHAYLAAYLLLHDRAAKVIAGEINLAPAQRARQTALNFGLQDRLQVRLGAGLTILQPGEVDTVVVAGLGGNTIIEVLESNPPVLPTIKRLILQPNIGAAAVRYWLCEHGWAIVEEALVKDNDIFYEIVVGEPGETQALNWLQATLGPRLLERKPAFFYEWVQLAIAQRRRVAEQLLQATDAAAASKRAKLVQEISELQEVIK